MSEPEVALEVSTEEEDGITYVHLHTDDGCYMVRWMDAMQLASQIMQQACAAAAECGADRDTITTAMSATVNAVMEDE